MTDSRRSAGWRLRKFSQLRGRERGLFLEAFVLLGLARLAVLTLPCRWITGWMGAAGAETPSSVEPALSDLAAAISREVQRASRYTPWRSQCLPQAMAAKRMLRRRGHASTLYLGVARQGRSSLSAHAWLRCGTVILTGFAESRRHAPVAQFAERV